MHLHYTWPEILSSPKCGVIIDFNGTMISFILPTSHYSKCQMLIQLTRSLPSYVLRFTKFTGVPDNETYWSYRQHWRAEYGKKIVSLSYTA